MEKDIHASHKGQGAATNREKGQGVTRTRAGAAPCKNGLARTLIILQGGSKIESSNRLFDWLKHIFQPIKKPVRTLSIFTSMAFVKDANGISFKNRLKGHINWRKVFPHVLFWFVYDTSAVRRLTLTIGVSLERKITRLSTGGNIF